MKKRTTALFWLALPLAGVMASALARAAGPAPDAIYYNGKIFTANQTLDIVQALAVREGKIVALGSNDEIRSLAAAATHVVDLQGKTMLPGFYDNHTHVWEQEHFCIDSPADLKRALQEQAAKTPKGEWIVVHLLRPYWHMQNPTRWEVDKIVPDHPVVLDSSHTMSVNSLALQKAGVTKDSADPEDGWIVRDKNREPVGILFELGAKQLITRVMPPPPRVKDEDAIDVLHRYLATFPPMGVTSMNVAGVFPPKGVTSVDLFGMSAETFRRLQAVYERWGETLPRMTVQFFLFPGYDAADNAIRQLESLPSRTGAGNVRLKIGAIKMNLDGGIAAPAFWTLQPYRGATRFKQHGPFENPDFRGVATVSRESFARVARRAHQLGWQLGVHVIGDAAVAMAVDVLDEILRENPRADHRHYLHHFTVKPPEATLQKMAKLGILVASQPNFTYYNNAFMLAAVSGDRLATQNPAKSLVTHGIRLTFGSDGHPYGPLTTVWSAVTRKGYDGKVYGAEEAVGVQEAIRYHTAEVAYQTFDEQTRGSLEVGKAADMLVLADDILTIDPQRIRDIAVERTIIGGKEVFTGHHVQPYYQTLPKPGAFTGLRFRCG